MQNKPHLLCVGRVYLDVSAIVAEMPEGDMKVIADDSVYAIGGNAVNAAFCAAKLGGISVHVHASIGSDFLGRGVEGEFHRRGVDIIPRFVPKSALSFIRPHDGKRAIIRCAKEEYEDSFPRLDVNLYNAVHFDGHQIDAALYHVKQCREKGILTSLDGGSVREGINDLLDFIDVAVVSEQFCKELGHDIRYHEALSYLKGKGVKVGAVTCGEHGIWYFEGDSEVRHLDAIRVPKERVVDTNGAGDVFHGAYLQSYLHDPRAPWEKHLLHGAAAAAYSVQFFGIEASLPTFQQVEAILADPARVAA